MAIVLLFNEKSISAFQFKKKKKQYLLQAFEEIKNIVPLDLLNNSVALNDLLMQQFSNNKSEKFYVLLNGFNIQYRTFFVSETEFENIDKAHIEDTVLHLCKKNLPKVSEEIHKSYTPCVMSACQTSKGYYISSAFIPTEYINNLKQAYKDNGLCLISVSPKVFGLFNCLNLSENQTLIYTDDQEISGVNFKGLYVWPKPYGCQIIDDDVIEIVKSEIEKLLDINSEFVYVTKNEIEMLIREGFNIEKSKIDITLSSIIAAGALLPYKPVIIKEDEDNELEENEGGLQNVISQLRKLFNSNRDEE